MTSKPLNIFLWLAQVVLAGMFIMAGTMKTFTPIEELSKSMPWINEYGAGLARFIGVSELLGGIGILLPSLLRIKPILSVWAGIGLSVIMFLAIGFHILLNEYAHIMFPIVLFGLALFVTWGRAKKVPIQAR